VRIPLMLKLGFFSDENKNVINSIRVVKSMYLEWLFSLTNAEYFFPLYGFS
jgi:hypothetical protein